MKLLHLVGFITKKYFTHVHLLVLLHEFKCLWYIFTFILVLELHHFWIGIIMGFTLYCEISSNIYFGAGTTFATSITKSTTLLIIERFCHSVGFHIGECEVLLVYCAV